MRHEPSRQASHTPNQRRSVYVFLPTYLPTNTYLYTGVLRVFNVSQKQPIDHIRLGTEGITAFIILPG